MTAGILFIKAVDTTEFKATYEGKTCLPRTLVKKKKSFKTEHKIKTLADKRKSNENGLLYANL